MLQSSRLICFARLIAAELLVNVAKPRLNAAEQRVNSDDSLVNVAEQRLKDSQSQGDD